MRLFNMIKPKIKNIEEIYDYIDANLNDLYFIN